MQVSTYKFQFHPSTATEPRDEPLPLYIRIQKLKRRESIARASTELALDAIPRDSRYSQSELLALTMCSYR